MKARAIIPDEDLLLGKLQEGTELLVAFEQQHLQQERGLHASFPPPIYRSREVQDRERIPSSRARQGKESY